MVPFRAIRVGSHEKSTIRKTLNCIKLPWLVAALLFTLALHLSIQPATAQETTGGLQGTVKDPSGAVVPNADLVLTSPTLVGSKELTTDAKGYFRFANLPPGTYSLKVNATGFETLVRAGMGIEVGHLPTLDLTMTIGGTTAVVEVTAAAPLIDTTTNTTLTNIPEDVIQEVPHGRSYQSVIQFAPSARNEPLMGSTRASSGTGGVSPGNGSNGNAYGFSVAGGSDSENSYLVEGQETANLIGGFSHTNVPFDFIQEVQIKSSGIEAEHGGSLGGVINVVMKKGSSNYHGAIFTQFENQEMDGHPIAFSRYDPSDSGTNIGWGFIDPVYQNYQPRQPKTSDVFPGFTFGGPLIPSDLLHGWGSSMRDKLYAFAAFNPEFNDEERKIVSNGALVPFSRDTQTYYSTARLDASITDKIRVFGSWLYQYQRQAGENLPTWDSIQGYVNPSASNPAFVYGHNLGYAAPNMTVNTGADITITPRLVSTSRFGYYFENYHDYGFPTDAQIYNWQTNGVGGMDTTGADLPDNLQQLTGYLNAPSNQNFTSFNSSKAIQFDQDVAWFRSGWAGTHNFKFGYQLNRLSNTLIQHYNEPYVQMFVGNNSATNYSPETNAGAAYCSDPANLAPDGNCQGQYGYIIIQDFGTNGHAISYNHGLFAQDSWQIGRGITINAGIRFDKEYLPGEAVGGGAPAKPINFNWTDKVAPRLGAAWDVFKNGKMKVFGSYGEFYDTMKLNLAISSFGGQYWDNCAYALNTPDYTGIQPVFGADGRYCGSKGGDSQEANFSGGATPPGLNFIENVNFRAFPTTCSTCSASQEGVAPGLKPYKQHETVFGVDYQLSRLVAFEARYDRRRLDHVIEDSAIYGVGEGETFVVVNPGQGVNSTFLGFCSFLYGADQLNPGGACSSSNGNYPPNNIIPAARSYDGLELRVTKAVSNHWFGMASYTYSHFRGNYTGLTSSDIADGGLGGRNSPNNSRSFDEPYFSYNSMGGSSSGPLPTDRPNVFKADGYYQFAYLKKFSTNLGLFQTWYQGSPNTSYMDIGLGGSGWPVDLVNRGKWVDVQQDPTTGAITLGNARTYRNSQYIQSDFNFEQVYKVTESKTLSFTSTFTNLFNQHAVTAINEQIDTGYAYQFGTPQGQDVLGGVAFYAAAMQPYNLKDILTSNNSQGGPITVNSQYGKPLYYQLARQIRLGFKFSF
jgi:Carboxypeptidase regulatory-like domain